MPSDTSNAPKKTRKARGEGSLYRRGAGWVGTVPLGHGLPPKVFYGKTQEEVREKRDSFKADVRAGRAGPSNGIRFKTLGDWVEGGWLAQIKPHFDAGVQTRGLAPVTYGLYASAARRRILPYLGRVKLSGPDQINYGHIQQWWERLEDEGVAPTSRLDARKTLVTILNAAMARADETGVERNVAARFKVRPVRAKEKPAPSADVIRALSKAAEGDRWEIVLYLGWYLGLRRGEMGGLQFGDFHTSAPKPFLSLQRHVIRTKLRQDGLAGGVQVQSGTKMHSDDPTPVLLPLLPEVVAHLEVHRARMLAYYMEHRDVWTGPAPTTAEGLLFPTRKGLPQDPWMFNQWFDRIRKQAGCPERTLHGLRHDFASFLANSGLSLTEIAKLLRHRGTAAVTDLYTHLTDDRAHETISAASVYMQGVRNGTN